MLLRLLREICFLHSNTNGHKNPHLFNLYKIPTRHWQIAPIQTNPATLYKRQRRILHWTASIPAHPRIANQRNARKPNTIPSHLATPVITMTPPREDLPRPFIELHLYPPWKKKHTNQQPHKPITTLNTTTNNKSKNRYIQKKTSSPSKQKEQGKTISPLAPYSRLVGAFADVTSTLMQKKTPQPPQLSIIRMQQIHHNTVNIRALTNLIDFPNTA